MLFSSVVRPGFSLLSSDLQSQQLESSGFQIRPESQWAGIYQPNFTVLSASPKAAQDTDLFAGTPALESDIQASRFEVGRV